MIYVFGLIILALIVYAIAKAASGDRYSKMSEEEFEAEAKRSSLMGAAVADFQKFVDPSHHVEYIQEQQFRVEADGAELGDKPESGQKE